MQERILKALKTNITVRTLVSNPLLCALICALNKFYKDSTLLNQEFVKDGSKTIAQMLDGSSKGLTITAFKRVALG